MSDSCAFDFAAPQFLESLSEAATLADQDGADSFFDTTPASPMANKENFDIFYTPYKGNLSGIKEEEVEEMDQVTVTNNDTNGEPCFAEEKEERPIKKAKRRTPKSSVIRSGKVTFDGIEVNVEQDKKEHMMMTRQDKILLTPVLELRSRQIVRESLKRKASPKPNGVPLAKKFTSKFISLAEEVMHFHFDTPPRLKSRHTTFEVTENKSNILKPTIPNSPMLLTKLRVRPNAEILEEEEDELNHQFKANKLNMKIFEKPDISDKPKAKSPTVPKPFNLTETSKKTNTEISKGEIFQFKARPVPTKSSMGPRSNSTWSKTLKRGANNRPPLRALKNNRMLTEDSAYGGMSTIKNANISTQIKPFSFDERDKEMLRKKEEKIKRLQEESFKIPAFHATPLPAFAAVNSTMKSCTSTISLCSNISSIKGGFNSEAITENNVPFKAKFPSVLHKEPFVPQKLERQVTETLNITLNTERRARERQQFEKKLQMKREEVEQEVKSVTELMEKKNKKELIEYRKKLVHKAKPAPQYVESQMPGKKEI